MEERGKSIRIRKGVGRQPGEVEKEEGSEGKDKKRTSKKRRRGGSGKERRGK